jgi:hypothetical protein
MLYETTKWLNMNNHFVVPQLLPYPINTTLFYSYYFIFRKTSLYSTP